MPGYPIRLCGMLALTAGVGACGDPRNDAANELVRLHEAVREHSARYGQLPERLEPAGGSDAGALPFQPRSGVRLELRRMTQDRYVAVASKRSWRCWLTGTRDRSSVPDCAPTGGGQAPSDSTPPVPLAPVAPQNAAR